MTSRLYFLIAASLIILFVTLAVLVSHTVSTRLKQYFALICLSLISWQVLVYVTSVIQVNLLLLNNLTFIGPALALVGSYKLAGELVLNQQQKAMTHSVRRLMGALDKVFIIAGVAILVALISNRIFINVNFDPLIGYSYERSWFYGLYIVSLLLIFFCTVLRLTFGFRLVRHDTQGRLAIKVFIASITLTAVYGIITNVVVPLLTSSDKYLSLGLLSIDIFAAGLAVAIVRYRFLDIRSYVFRSVVYLFTLGTLAIIYIAAISLIGSNLLELSLESGAVALFAVITLVAAVSFQSLKNYFNKITNRVFFQDVYDPQELFNEFNKTIVTTIDLSLLLRRTSSVIATYLKSNYCVVGVKDADERRFKIAGTQTIVFTPEDTEIIRDITGHIRKSVVTLDVLSTDQEPLKRIFDTYGIGALVRLTPNVHNRHEGVGYIILGVKKSGNSYSSQDIKSLETLGNELIIALQNALRFEEIERFNETLQAKVKEATMQLRESNRKLKELNDSKDDFIGMASHQLRTPLTAVKGYVSLVMDGDAGKVSKQQQELLRQAFTSAQRMVYLIADLLNVSRLKTGKFIIERVPTDLSRLINDELDQLQETATARKLTLEFTPPEGFPSLMLDEMKTRQVIMNFIDNAIYYTPAGGHISVELHELPRSIELRVIDDGIGVPAAERHHLFSKFYRAHNAQRARPDGTGLGLFMAKKVVIAQGGALIFESKEGKGSVFGFIIPKNAESQPGVS